eukprot:TRINITY_DN644_c0_g1_i1.p1 TRINITY_DN644_c0_g1~~TRINITY_DN644_c0_g1_i1.p1  ORF type:complete len:288 (+),score=58.79 TRINITY_DN644_c0_g1_i1:104-967(+)
MLKKVIRDIVSNTPTSDGAGVRLFRAIGTSKLKTLDPFLMLDEIKSDKADDYIEGFPDHPHRGFETVTYLLHGNMLHQDHKGNSGNLVSGSIQWMTAGRGIIHSETPQQKDGLMWGFQLWVNLPAAEKMKEPKYQDIPPERVPEVKLDERGSYVRVLAGQFDGAVGPVEGISRNPTFLDVRLKSEGSFRAIIPKNFTSFLYVYDGSIEIQQNGSARTCTSGHTVVFESSKEEVEEEIAVSIPAGGHGSFLCLAGRPIGEPIAWRGPFVMNTWEEIGQAYSDYASGRF